MTTNFFRALTFFLSIMTGFLFYLSAFFLIDTTKTSFPKNPGDGGFACSNHFVCYCRSSGMDHFEKSYSPII